MWITGGRFMPPGMGTGSVSRGDTFATRAVVSNAAEGGAVRRCSANSFRTSNLVCAWLDAVDRTSIAQKQPSKVVMRAAARHPGRCGDRSIGRMCIATSLFVFVLPQNRPRTNRQYLEEALYKKKLAVLPRIVLLGELPVNRNRQQGWKPRHLGTITVVTMRLPSVP